MNKFAIVVIGYNRINSMHRLIQSLILAEYSNEKVDLIISIDKSDNDKVEKFAESIIWNHGEKIIKTYSKRMGLKKHVLSCGDNLKIYDAIVVLEDDIYVSPNFFNYTKKATEYYENDENIAGISLYSHSWNVQKNRPFTPSKGENDVYFMQYAQSWGQIWMRKQWVSFIEWLKMNNDVIESEAKIPGNVTSWPESSWLKYHIKYCIDTNKYFVYPYDGLSTNFTEMGQHNNEKSSMLQVPMNYGINNNFNFPSFGDEKAIYYDAFFERENLGNLIGIEDQNLCVDMYGGKETSLFKKYLLSSKNHNYKILKQYGLDLRPHEMNVIYGIKGKDIFLYDTSIIERNNNNSNYEIIQLYYDMKVINYELIMKVIAKKFFLRFFKK